MSRCYAVLFLQAALVARVACMLVFPIGADRAPHDPRESAWREWGIVCALRVHCCVQTLVCLDGCLPPRASATWSETMKASSRTLRLACHTVLPCSQVCGCLPCCVGATPCTDRHLLLQAGWWRAFDLVLSQVGVTDVYQTAVLLLLDEVAKQRGMLLCA